jgi:Phosphate-selective porin O and P
MLRRFACFAFAVFPLLTYGQESWEQKLTFHGFGEWAYAKTDGNDYLGGSEKGDYDRSGLALNVTAELSPQLKVVGQMAVRNVGNGTASRLDYAFAQWDVADRLQVRAGRSKQPFGIYNEIYDVGTLRPFFYLPQSLYGPTQGYNGLGITGIFPLHDWELQYDVYGGEIGTPQTGGTEDGSDLRLRDAVGARVKFNLPMRNLSVGVSSYRGTFEETNIVQIPEGTTLRFWDLQAEYTGAPVTLRAEYGGQHTSNDANGKPGYVEAAYRFAGNWEIAGRYDHNAISIATPFGDQKFSHRDVVAGLNYWFNPNLVVKLSLHNVNGLLVAKSPTGDTTDKKTRAVVFGTQFSF